MIRFHRDKSLKWTKLLEIESDYICTKLNIPNPVMHNIGQPSPSLLKENLIGKILYNWSKIQKKKTIENNEEKLQIAFENQDKTISWIEMKKVSVKTIYTILMESNLQTPLIPKRALEINVD